MSTIGDTLTAQATNAAAQRGTAYASAVALGTSKLHMRHSSSADADVNAALTSAPARSAGPEMYMVEVSDAESQDGNYAAAPFSNSQKPKSRDVHVAIQCLTSMKSAQGLSAITHTTLVPRANMHIVTY